MKTFTFNHARLHRGKKDKKKICLKCKTLWSLTSYGPKNKNSTIKDHFTQVEMSNKKMGTTQGAREETLRWVDENGEVKYMQCTCIWPYGQKMEYVGNYHFEAENSKSSKL